MEHSKTYYEITYIHNTLQVTYVPCLEDFVRKETSRDGISSPLFHNCLLLVAQFYFPLPNLLLFSPFSPALGQSSLALFIFFLSAPPTLLNFFHARYQLILSEPSIYKERSKECAVFQEKKKKEIPTVVFICVNQKPVYKHTRLPLKVTFVVSETDVDDNILLIITLPQRLCQTSPNP